MRDIKGVQEQLRQEGCKIRTVHVRPIVEGKRDKFHQYHDVFPDGSALIGYGTAEQLEKIRKSIPGARFHETGGQTMVTIIDKNGSSFRGTANCLPEHIALNDKLVKGDQFCRNLGRRIALGRALKRRKNIEGQFFYPGNPNTEHAVTITLGQLLGEIFEEQGLPKDADPHKVEFGGPQDNFVMRLHGDPPPPQDPGMPTN